MFETLIDHALRTALRQGRLTVTYPSGRTETYGRTDTPRAAIRLKDMATLRALAIDPQLALGEAYMDGRLVIEEGDSLDLISIGMMADRPDNLTPFSRAMRAMRVGIGRLRLKTGLGRAQRNIAHHYDLDERLYRLFLDADMQYSCAYFADPAMTLDQAQLAKKRRIAAKLRLTPEMHVLDIGCGWGGMALYLARVTGVRVTGITLSKEQLRVAEARAEAAGLADRVTFRLLDYRRLRERFDAIVSVGMLEHVGIPQMQTFMDTVARVLAPGGRMLLHTMTQLRPNPIGQPFISKYIFPGGHIPAKSEVIAPAERAGLLITDVEVLSLHYAETTKEWRRRFHARRADVLKIYDDRFIRMWDFYLAGSEATFRCQKLHVSHFLLAHDQDPQPSNRAYMAEAEAALIAAERRVPEYAALLEPADRADAPAGLRHHSRAV